MSHYLSRDECKEKAKELEARQADAAYDIKLRLLKDEIGWYADVPTHTRSENAMVAGADVLCDRMAEGDNELVVAFRTIDDPNRSARVTLTRLMHRHGFGAEYLASGLTRVPFPIYL